MIAEEIRMMSDPVEMKKRSRDIKTNSSVWTEGRRLQVMEEALTLKFTQNQHLLAVLLSTAEKDIWECRKTDSFFGSGMSVNEMKRCNDLNQVQGQNHLGKLLVKVRNLLK